MNRFLNHRLFIREYSILIRNSKLNLIPYKEQYESRDNENEIQNKKTFRFFKEKNEYKSNVSTNLDNKLKLFYKNRYNYDRGN
tara:strand:+ start:300 stop:548 length:249 start_codon:yes stop_codon:yes gene_type:complete